VVFSSCHLGDKKVVRPIKTRATYGKGSFVEQMEERHGEN